MGQLLALLTPFYSNVLLKIKTTAEQEGPAGVRRNVSQAEPATRPLGPLPGCGAIQPVFLLAAGCPGCVLAGSLLH